MRATTGAAATRRCATTCASATMLLKERRSLPLLSATGPVQERNRDVNDPAEGALGPISPRPRGRSRLGCRCPLWPCCSVQIPHANTPGCPAQSWPLLPGTPTLRSGIVRERRRASRLPSVPSALRGLDPRHALPVVWQLSERRRSLRSDHSAGAIQPAMAMGRTVRTSSARRGSTASSGTVTTPIDSPSALKSSRRHAAWSGRGMLHEVNQRSHVSGSK